MKAVQQTIRWVCHACLALLVFAGYTAVQAQDEVDQPTLELDSVIEDASPSTSLVDQADTDETEVFDVDQAADTDEGDNLPTVIATEDESEDDRATDETEVFDVDQAADTDETEVFDVDQAADTDEGDNLPTVIATEDESEDDRATDTEQNLFELETETVSADNPDEEAVFPQSTTPGALEEVIVTGSRIKGASETGLLPVTVLGADELEAFGEEATGDILANLAQAGTFEFSETADGPNDARGDVATVNLRGLGSGNTLVLLNGRRYVMHPFTQDVDSTPRAVVNVNSIPSSAIARTEILKDGASGIYGADAAAGVVNLVLNEDFEGTRITVKSTQFESSDLTRNKPEDSAGGCVFLLRTDCIRDSVSIKFAGGYTFNDNTHWNIFASAYSKEGIFASERSYSASVDSRGLLPDFWVYDGDPDTDFRNRSSLAPWGQFQAGQFIDSRTFEGINIGPEVHSTGGFHVQPIDVDGSVSGTLPFTRNGQEFISIDDDQVPGALDPDLRYDVNVERQLSPAIKRYNLFSTLHHDFDNGMRFFGELAWYNSSSQSQRAAQPLDVGLAFVVVPAQNYWNPFGPGTFADGSANPNRIGGPEEGTDLLITGWRPVDIGPRLIETKSFTYRALAGLKGVFGNWDWESAFFYSFAQAEDIAGNRISKTALFQELSRSDEDALNPFGGPGFHTAADFDPVRIGTTNVANSSLTSWDFQVTRPDLFYLASDNGAGLALGVSWRHETYEDDRDPRLDGSIVYLDGLGSNRSDVAGVSPTADSVGKRNVYSAYAELLVPIVSDKPGAHRLDFQVAVRFESFDDIDQNIIKPKVALSWAPVSFMTFRAGYSQGFRAPNLVQLFRGDIGRLNRGLDDFWRDQADLSDASGNLYRRNVRISNIDLKAEDTETTFIGLLFNFPFGDSGEFLFSFDLWSFEQENVISTFGALEQLALDFDLRQQGSFNPNVVRAAPTAGDILAFVNAGFTAEQAAGPVSYIRDRYINLDPRSVRGYDLTLRVKSSKSRVGRFTVILEASRLLKFDQENLALEPLLGNDSLVNSQTNLGEELRGLSENRRRLDGNPTWRASGSVAWRKGGWGVTWSVNYVDDFFDTSAVHDETGEFWLVKDWFTTNLFVDYRFSYRGLKRFRVRLGLTNLTDQQPPLADAGRGYSVSYHHNRGRRFSLSLSARF